MFYIRVTNGFTRQQTSYFPRLTKSEIRKKIAFWKNQPMIVAIAVIDQNEQVTESYSIGRYGWHKDGY